MLRPLALTFQYYRLLLFNNVLFSLMLGTLAFAVIGKLSFGVLLFVKILAFAAATGHYYYMYNKSYYYYRNAGISVKRLYAFSFAVDLVLFFVLLTIFNLCVNLR